MDRDAELNKYWLNISRAVNTGDFAAYKASYHEDAVYISELTKTSIPIREAFKDWQQSFNDTKEAKIKVNLQFKFSQRLGDEKTAFETGVFLYTSVDRSGLETVKFLRFEAVLVKRKRWQMLLEHQKLDSNKIEWDLLT